MEIIKIVRDYITSKHTDGALLINGEWGIGKSYFVRNKVMIRLTASERLSINPLYPEQMRNEIGIFFRI